MGVCHSVCVTLCVSLCVCVSVCRLVSLYVAVCRCVSELSGRLELTFGVDTVASSLHFVSHLIRFAAVVFISVFASVAFPFLSSQLLLLSV